MLKQVVVFYNINMVCTWTVRYSGNGYRCQHLEL